MRLFRTLAVLAVPALVVAAGAAAFGFTDDSRFLPVATVGSGYSAQVHARNGCPPYSFRLDGSAALPAGLTIGPDGTIAGSATRAGTTSFWLAVHDSCGGDSQMPFSLTVLPAAARGEIGSAYTAPLTAVGAPDANNTWSLAAGTLPAGLALDPAGTIEGVPAAAGTFPVQLRVFNPGHLTEPLPLLQLTLTIAAKPHVLAKHLAPTRAGRPFRVALSARGGLAPFRWHTVPGTRLPAGIRLNAATGALIGTPRKAGLYRFGVAVTDRFGSSTPTAFSLRVLAARTGR